MLRRVMGSRFWSLHPVTSPQGRKFLRRLAVVLWAGLGFWLGANLAPPSTTQLGPLTVTLQVIPSIHPGISVELPPAGSVRFATHWVPVEARAHIQSVDAQQAKRILDTPNGLRTLTASAPDVVRAAAIRAGLWSLGCGLAGALLLTGLLTRSIRRTLLATSVCFGLVGLLTGLTALTFRAESLAQPKFTGLLSSAPYVQRKTQTLADRLESYRSGLADFVESVTTLYAVGDQLPIQKPELAGQVTTVLHISDIHLNPIGYDLTKQLVEQFKVAAIVDSGDLSTWGTQTETNFVNRIDSFNVPYVFVRGNHDSPALANAVADQPGAVVLDGQLATVAGLRMAGVADPRNSAAAEGANPEGVDQAVQRLGEVLDGAKSQVDLAIIHDPTRLEPLQGKVPLILSGHVHERSVRLEEGTRIMVQGSTGGAGLTANGLKQLGTGQPLPLQATLLYFANSGSDAGQLLAYDEITVGGLGLTSVTMQRTVIRPS